jgi:polysaccharide biosynthesis/export protein
MQYRFFRSLIYLACALLLAACAAGRDSGGDISVEDFQGQYSSESPDVEELNQQIMALAVASGQDESIYRLGAGDEISVDIMNVPDLSGNFRLDGTGHVSLPLIGVVSISGYSLSEAEDFLEKQYAKDYLRNPDIGIRMVEFRSQQFTAMGSVVRPQIYSMQRKVTLLEALAMAGGLSGNAGDTIYLTDRVRNTEDGEMQVRNLIIDVEELTQSGSPINPVLGESAVVNVPKSGTFFVEGAVQKPGVYTQAGDITVLKAITMAGGLRFEAKRSNINVLRRDPQTNEWDRQAVAMDEIRNSPIADIVLRDGDIVMVESGALRTAWVGAWEGLRRLVMVGFRPIP